MQVQMVQQSLDYPKPATERSVYNMQHQTASNLVSFSFNCSSFYVNVVNIG